MSPAAVVARPFGPHTPITGGTLLNFRGPSLDFWFGFGLLRIWGGDGAFAADHDFPVDLVGPCQARPQLLAIDLDCHARRGLPLVERGTSFPPRRHLAWNRVPQPGARGEELEELFVARKALGAGHVIRMDQQVDEASVRYHPLG